jgi:branched-chain amino acid transport system ATP-binding protein
MPLLETKTLSKHFGGLKAVNNVDIKIKKNEIVGLIGPNGAGKTTIFNLITGALNPTEGNVIYNGRKITGLKPHAVAKIGIVRTWQLTRLFNEYSMLKNVLMSQNIHNNISFFKSLLKTPIAQSRERELTRQAEEILDLLGLYEKKDELAKNLPHGHQRTLGIAMALAANPKLLLLDEPVGGMNPEESTLLMEQVKEIAKEKTITILIIEHDIKVIMQFCNRIIVLNYGEKIAEGEPQEIKENREVIQAYLGAPDGIIGS